MSIDGSTCHNNDLPLSTVSNTSTSDGGAIGKDLGANRKIKPEKGQQLINFAVAANIPRRVATLDWASVAL